jgi:hypothetical protein
VAGTISRVREKVPIMSTTKKNVLLLFILVCASLVLHSCKGKDANARVPMVHVGVWSGVDSENTKGMVTFRENGTGTMEFANNAYDFRYCFDYSKRPIWLDLLYSREGKPFRARLIVKYLDENNLQWYTFFSEVRPEKFPDGNPSVMRLARMGRP